MSYYSTGLNLRAVGVFVADIASPKIRDALVRVGYKIPHDDWQILHKRLCFVTDRYVVSPGCGGEAVKSYLGFYVALSPVLAELDFEFICSTIAHEFGHILTWRDGNSPDDERLADERAASWGFTNV